MSLYREPGKVDAEEAAPVGRIVEKRGWFWVALHWAVAILTFGQNRKFISDYWTTLGPVIGVPVGTDPTLPEHAPRLAHERRHIAQQERAARFVTLGLSSNAWVGLVPWGLVYLLVPLPAGLAWFRYVLEVEAYAEGFNVELDRMRLVGEDLGAIAFRREQLITMAVEQLTTGAYLWCWPFPGAVRRRIEARVP